MRSVHLARTPCGRRNPSVSFCVWLTDWLPWKFEATASVFNFRELIAIHGGGFGTKLLLGTTWKSCFRFYRHCDLWGFNATYFILLYLPHPPPYLGCWSLAGSNTGVVSAEVVAWVGVVVRRVVAGRRMTFSCPHSGINAIVGEGLTRRRRKKCFKILKIPEKKIWLLSPEAVPANSATFVPTVSY